MDRKIVQMTEEVIHAIDEELAYQNRLSASGAVDAHDNGLAGQLLTMERYLHMAIKAWVHSAGDSKGGHVECQDILRKVVATGVRALEIYGCPRRVQ